MRVAAAQIQISSSAEKNTRKIISYIEKSARKKADLICFPESAMIKRKKNIEDIYLFLKKIKEACKENKIYCIFGSYFKENGRLYNGAFLINKNGKLIYRYKKINLFRNERKKTRMGFANKVINTEFGKLGIVICWDSAYPEYVKRLAKQGVWVIFCLSYIKNYGRELESYLQIPYVRAFENSCYFVDVDSANMDCARYSVICSPSKIIKTIKREEGLITADLDRRKIIGLRRYYRLV